jgi:hypothetical protein
VADVPAVPYSPWLTLTPRLDAVIAVLQQALEDADSTPAPPNAADLTRASGQLVACIETLARRIGRTYRDELDDNSLEQLRDAVRHLAAAAAALPPVADALRSPGRRGL